MERDHPGRPGRHHRVRSDVRDGYRAIVGCLVASADEGVSDEELIDCLEDVSEPLVRLWVGHSRNIRFSPLEIVADRRAVARI